MPDAEPPSTEAVAAPRPSPGAWLHAGIRSTFLLRPALERLGPPTPALVLGLVAAWLLLVVAVERLAIPGDATFYAGAINSGWLATLVLLGLCWQVNRGTAGPPAAALFSLLLVQGLTVFVIQGALFVPTARLSATPSLVWSPRLATWTWMVFSVWAGIAAAVLLIRYAPRRPGTWVMVLAGVVVVTAARLSFPSSPFWYPVFDEDRTAAASRFRLTQEIMEAQPGVLEDALHGLEPERAGVIDLYAITFAPYAEEDVFRRESRLVADVMADRFDAAGRTVQLLNHQETATTLPWATPLNLQRTIARVAKVMNPQEDVLFIHLTSHGGADGKLAARMRPMDLDPVTPAALRQWLDDAHVRYAVISVSACYSGSWIAPLSGDGTLVMTAADAEHTSYGCGHLSELTYFGRAVYDEALRNTRSFEQAHATARTVIERREQEAGKSDGYSNPQISVGPGIRAVLGRLEARLDEGGR